MRSFKIEGIVIRRTVFSEADRLITILTKYQGKIRVVAKGVRKIKSRKAPHLELFNYIEGYIFKGRNIDIITEASTLKAFEKLRINLSLCANAYKLVELIDRLCPENQKQTSVFYLLMSTLQKLNEPADNPAEISEEFCLHLLWDLGFLPYGEIMKGNTLDLFLHSILERNLKSDNLIKKIQETN